MGPRYMFIRGFHAQVWRLVTVVCVRVGCECATSSFVLNERNNVRTGNET